MGTIITRKRKDGSPSYTAQLVKKQKGVIIWRQAQTFSKKREAQAWIDFKETELRKPGALDTLNKTDTTLADTIGLYLKEHPSLGKTKIHALNLIKAFPIALMKNGAIRSADIVRLADEMAENGRKPQTIGGYISLLSSVFRDAKPAWNIDLDYGEMQAAQKTLARLKKVTVSEHRERRPTLAELDKLMQFFTERHQLYPSATPMQIILPFAIFSTRRQEEITKLAWADLDEEGGRVLVRQMKHPGAKKRNDTWVELPPEAMRIVQAQPREGTRIFPSTTGGIGRSFTRATYLLGINTPAMPDAERLVFHDLRHEGVSRLFEMGRTIPLAASVSGHRSWQSLQRYAQIRQTGDKFENWPWLNKIAPAP